MHAWTNVGKKTEHPHPWGLRGTFSTIRKDSDNRFLFLEEHLDRIINSGKALGFPWIPSKSEISERLFDIANNQTDKQPRLFRISLFENLLGIADRITNSYGLSVEGISFRHKRAQPSHKQTTDKKLYESLNNLDINKKELILIDPKTNEFLETATSNLIFVEQKHLVIPFRNILTGINLTKIKPILEQRFEIQYRSPHCQEILNFDEIILVGSGRGISTLKNFKEFDWQSRNHSVHLEIKSIYDELIVPPSSNARVSI